MSRPVVLGNGMILVGLDKRGQLRDFYFPYVGSENHIGRRDVHKVGVWIDGAFSWFSDREWSIDLSYHHETMVGSVVAHNPRLNVTVRFTDAVYNEKNIFIRGCVVENHAEHEREIRLFFNQQFEISQTYYADTAYYNPAHHALIHYKSRRVFLVSARCDRGNFFTEYATGLFNIEGKEGTWRDAEDGVLSKNPVEHGAVDSTLGVTLTVPGGGVRHAHYWICVGETYGEVEAMHEYLIHVGEDHVIESTSDFWKAWVNKFDFTFYGLSDEAINLFKRSLLTIRTHCDNRGGILASGDSAQFQYGRDTYSYVWPRDGMFTALALDKAGYSDISSRFYKFCSEVVTEDGYVLHKYLPDKSLGSSWHPWIRGGKPQLAIQEDETALLLCGLWEYYRYSKDLEFVELVYNSFIREVAEFMMSYRDDETGLPFLSYGLWEERYGISTFTASTVYGAFVSAGKFAELLGKKEDRDLYFREADVVRAAIMDNLYDEDRGVFYKLISVTDEGRVHDSTIDISAFYGPFRFGVLPFDDERLTRAYEVTTLHLSDPIPIGGVARYEGDRYHRPADSYDDVPGNPWFVTTLWLTQYRIACATSEEDLAFVGEELEWCIKHAYSTGALSEQLDPYTGRPLSVAPLTWSHAEYVLTVIEYLHKLEELGVCTTCYPLRR